MMKFDPDIHHRHSIRLAGYDYSSVGFCFVTICVQERECLLGEIVDDRAVLNNTGSLAKNTTAVSKSADRHICGDAQPFPRDHHFTTACRGAACCARVLG